MEKHIAQTLSAATKLKVLCINAHWDKNHSRYRPGRPTKFQEILGECQFPQLRSLILQGFTSTERELVRFLRGSSYLQQLTFRCHKLEGKDNWESCTNEIKIALPTLEHISVDGLLSNYNDHSLPYHTHYCSRTDIQGFFFQGKANPFTCEQIRDERVCIILVATDDANRHHTTSWMTSYPEFQ